MTNLNEHKRNRSGFTLMEILTVLAIIVILASLLFPALRAAREQANKQKAKAMIASLEVAVNMYYTDVGAYPPAAGANTNSFYTSLGQPVTVGSATYGPYMEFNANELSGDAVLDPWNNAYSYTPPGGTQATVHISSGGPTDSADDDIKSW